MLTPRTDQEKLALQTGLRIMELRPSQVLASRRTRGALIQIMASRGSLPRSGNRAPATQHTSILEMIRAFFMTKPVLHG